MKSFCPKIIEQAEGMNGMFYLSGKATEPTFPWICEPWFVPQHNNTIYKYTNIVKQSPPTENMTKNSVQETKSTVT